MLNLRKSFLMGGVAAGAALVASAFSSILVVQASCTNPATIPTGFTAPCPVFSLSSTTVTQAQTLTLSATPQAGTDYIYTTAYVSQGTAWNPYTLAGNNAYPSYSSALASLTLSSTQLQTLSLGTHYAVVWDWLWDATANCYKGPGLNQCNTGQWRVQSFSLTSSATPTPSPTPTYTYSQAPYYAYSQSAYTGGSTPFTGTPYAIPGKIEAENYDKGGEGIAYHDTDAANQGGQYRTTEGVDIEATTDTNAGYDVGWTQAGEWLNYSVNVTAAGTYTLNVRVAANGQGGTFHFTLDGATLGSEFTVPSTGGWQAWTTLSQSVSLASGTHILKLVDDTAGSCGCVANYNWLQFTSGAYAYSQSAYYTYSQSAYTNPPTGCSGTNYGNGATCIKGSGAGGAQANETTKTTSLSPAAGHAVIVTAYTCADSNCQNVPVTTLSIGDNINSTEPCFAKSPHSPFALNETSAGTQKLQQYMWVCPSMPSGVTSITVTCSTANACSYITLTATEWTGLASANVFDADGGKASTVQGTTATVQTSTATTQANDLLYTFLDNTQDELMTPVNPYGQPLQFFSGNINTAAVIPTTGIQTAQTTWSPADDWYGTIAAIKTAATSYTYSQSSYYVYSQSSYYAYSQSSYTSYTYSQSAYTGGTLTAATCSSSDVQAKINLAAAGDTVNVPAGNCSWSGLTVNKAITLQGAGTGKTNITLSGSNTFTKAAAGVMRITGFSFSVSGGGNANQPFAVGGSWKSAQPIVFKYNAFLTNGSGLFRIGVAGGVIFSHDTFSGQWDDSFLQIKDPSDSQGSWSSADSIGTHDTNGTLNLYIEDNTFTGGTNQGIDCDDACRMVNRHNTFTDSDSNSHGEDSSAYGMRQFEIYSNQFLNTGATSGDTSQLANENQAVWIRGATGVIYNNYFDNLAGSWWGDKPEIRFNIRGAEDDRPQGTCAQVSYPVPHQLGQNYNGSSAFTDPIYLWSNTAGQGLGAPVVNAGWGWGNPCGFTWSTFFQWGRDGVNNGSANTAKPGYTPYTYPHPLAG